MPPKRSSAIYYTADDFKCTCKRPECNAELLDESFLAKMNDLLTEWGKGKILIDSGRRCAFQNARVGGKPDSQHLLGKAADLWLGNHVDVATIEILAGRLGFGGIGIANRWLHLDIGPKGRRWTYPAGVSKT